MNDPIRAVLVVIFATGLTACSTIASDPLLRLTLKAVDDEGKPVEGAKASFGGERRPKNPDESSKGVSVEGVTDAQGLFSGELEVWNAAHSGYTVEKSGYYPVKQHSYSAKSVVRGKWQPWNPTVEVVLKRKKNPVPMFAKRVDRGLDILNEPYGYDLQVGDWVKPHGKGLIADFIFTRTLIQRSENDFDYQLKVSFSNSGDGIQRFPPDPSLGKEGYQTLVLYEAPADGYASEWMLKRSRKSGQGEQTTFNNHSGYFFRVRTEFDQDGKVVKALYGKIYGDFFSMVYYLNPDGTRNIECDPKRNLLRPGLVNNRNRSTYEVGP